MRVEHVEVERVSGIVHGARSAKDRWPTRVGARLEVRTPDGRIGRGEASPLPGYSPDGIDAALSDLKAVDWAALPEPEALEGPELRDILRRVGAHTTSPSARFALETAYLDLVGQKGLRPIWSLLVGSERPAEPIGISAMIGGTDDADIVDVARAAIARGAAAVKVKLSGTSDANVAAIHSIRDAIGAAPLRLDANGTLDVREAPAQLAALRAAGIEFIEEPVPASDLAAFDSPLPIALDESLQEAGNWDRLEPHLERLRCVALVLKPMALGGVSVCLDWAERARARGLEVVLSHLFDGPVALTACAHLALAVGSRRFASGLDPHGGLGIWPETSLPLHLGASIVPIERPGLGIPNLGRGNP